MFQPGQHSTGPDVQSLLEWVDGVADRFEADWRTGRPPAIADYLDNTNGNERVALLRELVRIDLERRSKLGWKRSWEDYVREFPELKEVVEDDVDYLWGLTEDTPTACELAHDEVASPREPARNEKWPVIAGYQILAELGRGGMGTVYKARQQQLKRIVALKIIRSTAERNPRHQARFSVEAEAAARLQHPNIVQIYEVGHQDGVHYLGMEYVDGGSLAQRLMGKPQPARLAAELVAKLARAMHYAHEHGVIHRDIKPGNILLQIDSRQQSVGRRNPADGDDEARLPTPDSYLLSNPKITDFGLAKLLEDDASHTVSGTIVGTPCYMAPEQAAGKAKEVGPTADVYALGAILYEMLAGRPPFEGTSVLDTLEQIRAGELTPPSRLLPRMPRDVETICLKALAYAPAHRYASAGALADDLHRFLEREPIRARPVGAAERLWRWCRRHPARAGLVAAVAALLLTLVVASMLVALASTAQERVSRREGLVRQLQLVGAHSHLNGWSEEAWRLAAEAAALQKDATLRSLAANACAGLDARVGKQLEGVSVSWLALDHKGEQVLLGGRNSNLGQPLEGAKLWNLDTGAVEVSRQAGAGPVAFRRDGTPLQLVPADDRTLLLWNLLDQKRLMECRLSAAATEPQSSTWQVNELGFPVLALAREGTVAAAASAGENRRSALAVWDTASGHLLFQVNQAARTLALAPDGGLLAAGDDQGRITLWSVPAGTRLSTFEMGRVTVHCLVFSPDGKLLGVGDSAGMVTVWDIEARRPITYCRGAHDEVYVLAFNSDGTLIASGGRGPACIWDAATGTLLLSLRSHGLTTALAFSADDRSLILGSRTPARVYLWELERDRGLRTLRGLASQAAHLCFSRDGRLLAALAHNWQVMIWDVQRGCLRWRFVVPKGNADDDAALAFSPDGKQFACAAGEGARLWDMDRGRELASWDLPPGSRDVLAFQKPDRLLLFREEASDRPPPPGVGEAQASLPLPRVCRLRNLLGATPAKPVFEIAGVNEHLLDAVATPDGGTLIVEHTQQGPGRQIRTVQAYDSLTGAEHWSISSVRSQMSGTLALDPTGCLIAFQTDNRDDEGILVDVATGEFRGGLAPFAVCLGLEGNTFLRLGSGESSRENRGYGFSRRGDISPRLILGLETTRSFHPVFSRDGNFLAWSNTDGTVSVCELQCLRRRLSEVGLEW
ncbi:MAG TPA: WD40 repeat domain-containing serine/threonine-protein kinase [Gemmataceae bacterium]|nr:WD40 repeat domain-containing serine/threonine-protein kinase [Gemmataceae bacterium]